MNCTLLLKHELRIQEIQLPIRKVRACGRKQRKALGASAIHNVLPWSGNHVLMMFIPPMDITLAHPPTVGYSISLCLPKVVLFTEAMPINPMDNVPTPSNRIITLNAAPQPFPQIDETRGGFNTTEFLDKQFNPFVTENTPPLIQDISTNTVEHYHYQDYYGIGIKISDGWFAEINLYVTDVAGFSVLFTQKDSGETQFFTGAAGTQHFYTAMGLDYWMDVLVDYKINATCNDTAGNKAYYEQKINGVFGGFLDYLHDIWNNIVGAFSAAWNAVASAINILGTIAQSIIKSLFGDLIDKINSWKLNYVSGIGNALLQAWKSFNETGVVNPSTLQNIMGAIFDATFISILGIATTLTIGMMALTPLLVALPILIPVALLGITAMFSLFVTIPEEVSISPSITNLKMAEIPDFIKNAIAQRQSNKDMEFYSLIADALGAILDTLALLHIIRELDVTGVTKCVILITFGLISTIIGAVASLDLIPNLKIIANSIGGFLGLIGIISGVGALILLPASFSWGDLILTIAGIALSFVGLYVSLA